MRLTSLRLLRAPGLPRELALTDISPGLVLLVGPNASGKSTLGRVVQALLWPKETGGASDGMHALSDWQLATGPASAQLAAGSVRWEPQAPGVARASDVWRLSVAELLSSKSKADRRIADDIERALNGGYDIHKATKAFATSPRVPTSLRSGLDRARDKSKAALAQADALVAEERDLERLLTARKDALKAVGELVYAREAQGLAESRRQHVRQLAEMEAFPAELERLRGDEMTQVEELQADEQRVANEQAELTRRVAENDLTRGDLCWSGNEPSEQEVHAWRQRARNLVDLERDLRAAESAAAVAEATLAAASLQVLVVGPTPDQPGPAAALESLERHVQRRRDLRDLAQAEQRVVEAIPEVADGPDGAHLRQGIMALRAWLGVAASPASAAATPWLLILALVGLVLALLGLWLGGPGWALPGAVLVGLGAGAWLALRRAAGVDPGDTERRIHQDHFLRLAMLPPARWRIDDVQRHLAILEQQLDQANERALWSARLQVQRGQLERVTAELAKADAHAAEAAEQLGVAADWADLPLLQQAHRLNEVARAALTSVEADQTLATVGERWRAALRGLNQWLAGVDLEAVSDSAGAAGALDALTNRLTALQQARQTRKDLQRQVDGLTERGREAGKKIADLYERCSLDNGDKQTLASRLASLPAWRAAVEAKLRVDRQIADAEAALVDRPAMLKLDEAAAAELIAHLERRAGGLDDASAAVATVQERLASAAISTDLETARKVEHNAEFALAEARDKAAQDAVGNALSEWLRAQVSREHTPAVLERARALQLRFTRNAFDLQVDAEHGFVATDVKAERRRQLSELSDGTRMQALLAARLAFLEHTEADGPKLPLFLDEALSTTDPQRFHEVGAALLDLVAEGRQVFYATADVAEVHAWQRICAQEGHSAPQVIDLAEVASERPWHDDLPAAPTPRTPPPPTAGHDAASYARALGVSPPGVRDALGRWHVVFLLHDDLDAVARLVAAGIDTAGQFLAFRAGRAVPLPVDEAVAQRIAARARLLEAVLELRAVGRNRPLSWADVVASGGVTATFEAAMRELLADHGDDAGDYLAAVSALKGFRGKSRTAMSEHFVGEGFIAGEAPLESAELVRRAAVAVGPQLRDGVLSLAEVGPMVEWVERLIR